MQIDFSDKRVIAAAATAGIVAIVIIVLQSLILWGRSVPVQSNVTAPARSSNQPQMSREKLDTLKELLEERERSLGQACPSSGTFLDIQTCGGRCPTTERWDGRNCVRL
jgi:hypothetical protein